MGVAGVTRQVSFTRHIMSRGVYTTVNGISIRGLWHSANIARVQLYLNENDWGKQCYEVRFPYTVLSSPYNLINGMEVYRKAVPGRLIQRYVVRDVDTEEQDDEITQVSALVIAATQ